MRVVTISGIQGSGKTTLIRELITSLRSAGKKSAVIVNEQGKADFDVDFIKIHNLGIERIRGG